MYSQLLGASVIWRRTEKQAAVFTPPRVQCLQFSVLRTRQEIVSPNSFLSCIHITSVYVMRKLAAHGGAAPLRIFNVGRSGQVRKHNFCVSYTLCVQIQLASTKYNVYINEHIVSCMRGMPKTRRHEVEFHYPLRSLTSLGFFSPLGSSKCAQYMIMLV